MSGIVSREILPYSRTFLEKVPLQFVNLDELVKGALDHRSLAGDAYWQIDALNEPVAYLILRNGRPYRIVGYSGPSVNAFITWLRRDNRELTLTYRFVEDGTLPLLLRCWTEEPVLQDLENSRGDVMSVLKSVRKLGETGLFKLRTGGKATLIPIDEGRISAAFGPGSVITGKAIQQLLSEQLDESSFADYYPGPTGMLSQVGIAEAQLIVSAFNVWLEAASPTWPECKRIATTVFTAMKSKETCFGSLSYDPEDGMFLEALPVETDKMPAAFSALVKSLARKHPSPESCMKLFGSVNKEKKLALSTAGLAPLFEGSLN